MCSGIRSSLLLICGCLIFNSARATLQISPEELASGQHQQQVAPIGEQHQNQNQGPSQPALNVERRLHKSFATLLLDSEAPNEQTGRAHLDQDRPSAAALMAAAVASLDEIALPVGADTSASADNANNTAIAKPAALDQQQQQQLNPAEQEFKVNETQSPRSDKQQVLEMFAKFFTLARSHDDQQQKELVRDGVIMRLKELGFETSFLQKSRFEFRRRPAYSYNMISILPGRYRQTKHDRIVLIGAHWDSATKAPGVDDNGSGSTCLLEIARLISANRCSFNHTVMLVWFDYEEQGKYGSEFFVNEYLFPLELDKYGSKFLGAYILDMILVRDKENNTQSLPANLRARLSDFTNELEREKYRGDFLATWSRKTWDEPLEEAFRSAWIDLGHESRTFKSMRPELPQTRLPNSQERYDWKDFFRSDHASFWFPPLTSAAVRRAPNRTSTVSHSSLNAILLTDLGPWRKSYQKCYHSACDDEHLLTDGNLAFMQQVIDSLVLTLMRVGQGQCISKTPINTADKPPDGSIPSDMIAISANSSSAPCPDRLAPMATGNGQSPTQAPAAARGCMSSAQAH